MHMEAEMGDGKTFSQMVKEAGFISSAASVINNNAVKIAPDAALWGATDLLDKGRTNIDPGFSQQLNQVKAQKNMQANKAAAGFQ